MEPEGNEDFLGEAPDIGEDDEMFNGEEEDLGDDDLQEDEFAGYEPPPAQESSAYIPTTQPNTGGGGAAGGQSPAQQNGGGAQDQSDQSSPLIEFNNKFRKQVEEKDAKERELKQKRRDEASKQLSDWFKKRVEQLEKRKEQNRIEQDETQNEIMAAMDDSWRRVVSLVDVQNPSAGEFDISRMKDVLVQLKNEPLPEDSTAA